MSNPLKFATAAQITAGLKGDESHLIAERDREDKIFANEIDSLVNDLTDAAEKIESCMTTGSLLTIVQAALEAYMEPGWFDRDEVLKSARKRRLDQFDPEV